MRTSERTCFVILAVLAVSCSDSKQPDPAPSGAAGLASAAGGTAGLASGGASPAGTGGGGAPVAPAAGMSGMLAAGSGGASGPPQAGASAGGAGGASAGGGGSAPIAGANNGGAPSCSAPPPASPLIGWASMPGNGVATTTGGGNAAPVSVDTLAALNAALQGSTPAVIHVRGTIQGRVVVGSNKTVIGLCGAKIIGDVHLSRSVNVIIRNVTIVGNNCRESPNECSGGDDAVSVSDGAHHIWFDHADISDGSDGNLDITSGSDFVTVSWTKFHYSSRRTDPVAGASGHRFSNLIGSDDDIPADEGRLNVTFHHVWWADNVDQRMPRVRYGKIHVFNNLYTAAGNSYCVGVGMAASVRVENNVFSGVRNPVNTSFQDPRSTLVATGNVYPSGSSVTNIGMAFAPPYSFTLEPTASLEAAVRNGAGPK